MTPSRMAARQRFLRRRYSRKSDAGRPTSLTTFHRPPRCPQYLAAGLKRSRNYASVRRSLAILVLLLCHAGCAGQAEASKILRNSAQPPRSSPEPCTQAAFANRRVLATRAANTRRVRVRRSSKPEDADSGVGS